MKKSLYLGLIACAATMVSCSNDDVLTSMPASDNAIKFDVYNGKAQSRIVTGELNNEKIVNFGVFASYTETAAWTVEDGYDFMFNQLVEKKAGETSSTGWQYDPVKYWPTNKDHKISFWAYAPYAEEEQTDVVVKSLNTATNAAVITYTMNTDVNEMVDFTAGVVMNKTIANEHEDMPAADDADEVLFNLKHELTRVRFTANLDRDAWVDGNTHNQTQINITAIQLNAGNNLYAKADYTFATTTSGRGTWDLTNADKTEAALAVTPFLNVTTPALGGYVTPGVQVPTSAVVPLFEDTNYLYLIPSDASNNVKVQVTYDIVTVDGALSAGHSVSTVTKIVELPASTLAQGKSYSYNLTFGLHEVEVTATVDPWDEEGGNTDVDWTDEEPAA